MTTLQKKIRCDYTGYNLETQYDEITEILNIDIINSINKIGGPNPGDLLFLEKHPKSQKDMHVVTLNTHAEWAEEHLMDCIPHYRRNLIGKEFFEYVNRNDELKDLLKWFVPIESSEPSYTMHGHRKLFQIFDYHHKKTEFTDDLDKAKKSLDALLNKKERSFIFMDEYKDFVYCPGVVMTKVVSDFNNDVYTNRKYDVYRANASIEVFPLHTPSPKGSELCLYAVQKNFGPIMCLPAIKFAAGSAKEYYWKALIAGFDYYKCKNIADMKDDEAWEAYYQELIPIITRDDDEHMKQIKKMGVNGDTKLNEILSDIELKKKEESGVIYQQIKTTGIQDPQVITERDIVKILMSIFKKTNKKYIKDNDSSIMFYVKNYVKIEPLNMSKTVYSVNIEDSFSLTDEDMLINMRIIKMRNRKEKKIIQECFDDLHKSPVKQQYVYLQNK